MDRRSLLTAGLAAFFVLDLVLVVWAVRWSSTPTAAVAGPVGGTPTPSSSVSTSPVGEPSSSPTATPSASPSAASKATTTSLTRFVVAASATEAWVASTGTCEKPGSVSVTDDGGDSWSTRPAPGAVTRIRPTSGTEAFVIGGDGGCDLRLWTTDDAARSWGDPGSAGRGWARVPGTEAGVHTPRDDVARPCGRTRVLDLSVDGATRATALCAGGQLRVTTDSGQSWEDGASVEGAVSVAGREDGTGVLAVLTPECPGTVVSSFAGGEVTEGTCFDDAVPVAGRTSVSVSGQAVWLLAGDAVWRAPKLGDEWVSAGSLR